MSALQEAVEPEMGQVYKQSRNDNLYQILYLDEQIVLLRSEESRRDGENIHRIEKRANFDRHVEEGWFEYHPESDVDMLSSTEMDWSEVDHIGEKTKENLYEAGFKTNIDVRRADDDDLLDVDGLGKAGLKNLRAKTL